MDGQVEDHRAHAAGEADLLGWIARRVDDEDVLVRKTEPLERLEGVDERKGKIVTLRFFAGLTIPEIAEVLELSPRSVEREWTYIKAWLARELRDASRDEEERDSGKAEKA